MNDEKHVCLEQNRLFCLSFGGRNVLSVYRFGPVEGQHPWCVPWDLKVNCYSASHQRCVPLHLQSKTLNYIIRKVDGGLNHPVHCGLSAPDHGDWTSIITFKGSLVLILMASSLQSSSWHRVKVFNGPSPSGTSSQWLGVISVGVIAPLCHRVGEHTGRDVSGADSSGLESGCLLHIIHMENVDFYRNVMKLRR